MARLQGEGTSSVRGALRTQTKIYLVGDASGLTTEFTRKDSFPTSLLLPNTDLISVPVPLCFPCSAVFQMWRTNPLFERSSPVEVGHGVDKPVLLESGNRPFLNVGSVL